jgi:peroxiredoxin
VVWLAVNSTHWWNVEQNGRWHEKKELDYPLLADPTGEVGKAYGAKTTPHMFVIDTKGKIAYQGAIDDNPLGKKDRTHNHVGKVLDRLLADKNVEAARTKPYGCSVKYAPESQIPAVTLKDQAGSDVDLRKADGKITVLEFVNPDCPFVKRHYRQGTMKKLAEKYRDKDVRWLAVNTTHYFNVEKNKSFHDAHDLPYPVLDDSDGKVGKALEAKTTPHMFVFDKNGQLVYHGAIDSSPRGKGKDVTNHVDEALSALVEGKAPETAETKPYGCSVKYKPDKSK